MSVSAYQITDNSTVYCTACLIKEQKEHHISALLGLRDWNHWLIDSLLKIIAWLTTKKSPKPSHDWRNHLGLFFFIYIYQEITKIGAWVCNLRNFVLQHCHYSNTNPLTTRLFAHSLFGLTNKDRVTDGTSSQGSHNYAMCFHINTSSNIFILWVFSWYQS